MSNPYEAPQSEPNPPKRRSFDGMATFIALWFLVFMAALIWVLIG